MYSNNTNLKKRKIVTDVLVSTRNVHIPKSSMLVIAVSVIYPYKTAFLSNKNSLN